MKCSSKDQAASLVKELARLESSTSASPTKAVHAHAAAHQNLLDHQEELKGALRRYTGAIQQ